MSGQYDEPRSQAPLVIAIASAAVIGLAVTVLAVVVNRPAGSGPLLSNLVGGGQRSLVEAAIRSKCNDPSALSIEQILYSRPIREGAETHQYVFVAVRDRSPFGGVIYMERVLRIVDNRRVVWLDGDEARLYGSERSQWSPNPAGPP